MSEVEKLYKNAGVEKQYYYFDSADGNTYTWELNENGNDKHNMCFIGKPKIKDREFTPEKQLGLIEFYIKSVWWRNLACFKSSSLSFDEELAKLTNHLWEDMTISQQEQIKRILE